MRLFLFLACLLSLNAAAQSPTREHFAPPGWEHAYHTYRYSPVVKVGDTVFVSGIPAAKGDSDEAKVRWMFEELKRHLAEAGATPADVVEVMSFHVTKDSASFGDDMETVSRIAAEYFTSHYPAWTAVATPALLSKDAPLELRAVAIIGSGQRPRARIAAPTGNAK
ncbi:MAG TPA: Rid family hydrolase [Lysobacter sp.]